MTATYLGRTLHLLPNGRLVARAERAPTVGERVYDRMMKPLGKVDDVFGPVDAPFISIRVEGARGGFRFEGMEIFTR
ncbi:MAG: Gar1/Naf1 family protein [Thermoplasmata archaeon]|nr:Gar1/Naf1 family protein [Thermoplasmata archaeon]